MTETLRKLFVFFEQIPYGSVIVDFLQGFPPALAAAGFVIGFFVASDLFAARGKRQMKAVDGLCTWSNYASFLFCVLLAIYILYTDTNQLLHYFLSLVAGAIVCNCLQAVLSWFGWLGWIIAVVLALSSGFVSGFVAWLYYKGALLKQLL